MKLRIAMIGTGAVGAIHAANLAADPDVELVAVYNPDFAAASAFALHYGFRSAARSLEEVCSSSDVALVCSPPKHHFQQALVCLEAGLHTLIELPACETVTEAEDLFRCAAQRGLHLGCAHTARYLQPYIFIGEYLRNDLAGVIQQINYIRFPWLNPKGWVDDALAHHAAHVLDLLLSWFGKIDPVSAMLHPDEETIRSVSLLARLPGGGSAAITVSYGSHLPVNSLLIVGQKHTLESDGFSFVRSEEGPLQQCSQPAYENAIRDQDRAFLAACRGAGDYIDWQDTIQLMRTGDIFRDIHRRQLTTKHGRVKDQPQQSAC